jgi:excisionase family DNA binding protein
MPSIVRQREDAERSLVTRRAISPTELAIQLGVSPASTLRACRDGRVRCTRFGKRFLIPVDEADRILQNESGVTAAA